MLQYIAAQKYTKYTVSVYVDLALHGWTDRPPCRKVGRPKPNPLGTFSRYKWPQRTLNVGTARGGQRTNTGRPCGTPFVKE